jgi:hypothetical protein
MSLRSLFALCKDRPVLLCISSSKQEFMPCDEGNDPAESKDRTTKVEQKKLSTIAPRLLDALFVFSWAGIVLGSLTMICFILWFELSCCLLEPS